MHSEDQCEVNTTVVRVVCHQSVRGENYQKNNQLIMIMKITKKIQITVNSEVLSHFNFLSLFCFVFTSCVFFVGEGGRREGRGSFSFDR